MVNIHFEYKEDTDEITCSREEVVNPVLMDGSLNLVVYGKCNSNCIYCNTFKANIGDYYYDELYKTIESSVDLSKINELVCACGEIFVDHKIREVYDKILSHNLNMGITLFTNGYSWSTQDLVKYGYADKIKTLFLSTFAYDNESYYKIGRTFRDGYDKIFLENYVEMFNFAKERDILFYCKLNLNTLLNSVRYINKILSVVNEDQRIVISNVRGEYGLSLNEWETIRNHYKSNKRMEFKYE